MTIKELQYATTIYIEGSFSSAAKKLYISQSALSQAIRKLEQELGFPIFLRSGIRTEPTREGKVFLERGRDILKVWQEFEDEMRIFAEASQSDISVGMAPFSMKNILPHALSRFTREYPDVRLNIIEEPSNKLEEMVSQELIDFCVIGEPSYLASLEHIFLFSAEPLVAIPINHPFCQKHPYYGLDRLYEVDLNELRDEPFSLLKNPRINHLWDTIFQAVGFDPIIYRRSVRWQNVKDYIKNGLSVGFIDEILADHEPEDDKIAYYRIGNGRFRRNMVLAVRPGKQFSKQEQGFLDALRSYRTITERQKHPQDPVG